VTIDSVTSFHPVYWRRGVVVSVVRCMNEVNARRARLVLGWVTRLRAGIPSWRVTSQLGQLSLAPLWGRIIEYESKGGNVASVGWQVTLCDPIWHESFRSGVAG